MLFEVDIASDEGISCIRVPFPPRGDPPLGHDPQLSDALWRRVGVPLFETPMSVELTLLLGALWRARGESVWLVAWPLLGLERAEALLVLAEPRNWPPPPVVEGSFPLEAVRDGSMLLEGRADGDRSLLLEPRSFTQLVAIPDTSVSRGRDNVDFGLVLTQDPAAVVTLAADPRVTRYADLVRVGVASAAGFLAISEYSAWGYESELRLYANKAAARPIAEAFALANGEAASLHPPPSPTEEARRRAILDYVDALQRLTGERIGMREVPEP